MEAFYLMANSLVVVMTMYAIKNMEGRKCFKMKYNLCRNYRVPNHMS